MALANESGQNSAALKNITVNTGTTKFNTAIEYDTDANNTAYSRVKHYINNGEAYSYDYDEAGNISRIQSPDGSWVSYEYDSLNQLTREYHSLPCVKGGAEGEAEAEGLSYDTIKYTYDTRGNILSKTYLLNGETVDTITYGYTDSVWKDRLTSYNGVTITADAIGNPTAWHDGSAMTWRRGRQLATYAKNGVTTTYSYNDDGIRTSKTVGTVTTTYNVVDGTLRRMTDGTNTLQFIYGNGLSSVVFNGTEYWYVFNAQGDIIGIINANGEYVVEYVYDSWGKPLSKTGTFADTLGTLNPFRYRGYIYDEESGFYYCQSRYYDPEVGRFLNADGYVSTGQGILGHNMFAYCGNNPVIRVDSSGQLFGLIVAFTVGVVVGMLISTEICNTADRNYSNNTSVDENPDTTTKNKLINDQGLDTGDHFDYGSYDVSYNGCGPIAIHNAKVLEGVDSTLSETIYDCQMNVAMTPCGIFGTAPYSIGRVLASSGIEYERVTLDEMTRPGTYIISYWIKPNVPFDGIHFVAVSYDGANYLTYNWKGYGNLCGLSPEIYASKFICGYYLK